MNLLRPEPREQHGKPVCEYWRTLPVLGQRRCTRIATVKIRYGTGWIEVCAPHEDKMVQAIQNARQKAQELRRGEIW